MFLLLLPMIFGTSLFVLSLLLILSGDLKKFNSHSKKPPKITELPIITTTGQIVNTVEELDIHLDFLRCQLDEKVNELECSKTKLSSTEENLRRLTDTSNEVKKYYVKLKTEISKSENECGELKSQIEDFQGKQTRLREEVNENVKYYTDLLTNIDGASNGSNDDYEMVKKVPLHGA